GKHEIVLKAGQKTEKWLTFPSGVRIGLTSEDYKYKIIYPNGDVKDAWKLKQMPSRYKFKLLALTDQNITLHVKQAL
ncbi:MAG: hypothetical protein U9R06_01885, partial [Patescibacteria group bacterium]|nr:hypothetical protein [Patescibacteria group bacterium]